MKSPSSRTFLPCLVVLALVACKSGAPEDRPQTPPPQVSVITVQAQDVPFTRNLVGRLSPWRSADIRARVGGVLLRRAYTEGTQVKKGQLLFQIDPTPLKTALRSARAGLAQALATYANARSSAMRAQKLAPGNYISHAELDRLQAAGRTAAAAVQVARAKVAEARTRLAYARVTSPIAGRAGEAQVTEGALVGYDNKASLLTTVEQINPLYVNFSLGVAEFERMQQARQQGYLHLDQVGQASVEITLPNGTTYDHMATLDFSAARVNSATGTIKLRAKVPNPDHHLLPGMYVTLKARLGQRRGVFLIPQPALLRDSRGAYVLSVDQHSRIVRHDVISIAMHGSDWIVRGNPGRGGKIVVLGLQKVRAGMTVVPIPWRARSEHVRSSMAHGS